MLCTLYCTVNCVRYVHVIANTVSNTLAYGMHTLLRTLCALYCTRYAYSIRNYLTYGLHILLLTRYAILYAMFCTRYCTYSAHGIYHEMRILWRMVCVRYTQSIAHDIRIGCSINRISCTKLLKVIMYSYLVYCIFINKEADGERRPDRAVRASAATWKYPTPGRQYLPHPLLPI